MSKKPTLIELTQLGLLRVTGEGAKKFLQGQLTCDLEEITQNRSRLGAHCNPQGRIISLFRLFLFHDNYYLQMPRELIPIAMAALKKYAVFFKVTMQDTTHELTQLGLIGNSHPHLPDDVDDVISTAHSVIIKVPGTEPRYLIISDPQQTANWGNITKEPSWHHLEIRAGIPAIYPETSEKFLPHEINLPQLNGVSFKKGCYTGQEIIARMEYRGKLKNHLYHAKAQTEHTPIRGTDIYRQNDRGGSIVDYCQVSYNNYELLVIAAENDISTNLLSLDPENNVKLEF